ncbi:ribosomal-protein-alanine N-acetyltransferase [Pseudodesulfovibrio sp. F-1]|uniref:[Ribosomal protein bS18]-alanine N-acetyltransferase n=1 Tax=Pseudodesulfovibrio alkaliphilus TaxID=2661613 RepID=A0A7K1KQZ2_9BACT|nr:ribosomal protein S18-alanine N-acetyltransferase [Pseudodesulfovibrio alkaliphilus]MUM78271.1 ribosomal-protein-alanine N-acetyltransferase [Pseudodesulfovibrio alkaliphilus]
MVERVVALGESDMDELMRLERLCFAYHWTREQFAMGLERGVYRVLGMRQGGRLAGYIAFSLVEDEMEILNLAVHPEHRRCGIGAALLARALEVCAKKGVAKSFLDVKASNVAAIDLYLKFGYEQIGVRKRYYPDTGDDALLFRHEIRRDYDQKNQ